MGAFKRCHHPHRSTSLSYGSLSRIVQQDMNHHGNQTIRLSHRLVNWQTSHLT